MLRRPCRPEVPALFGALLALGAASCAPPDLTASYELSGIVSERFESGTSLAPVGGATVTFVSDTGLSASSTTGGDGRYRMIVESDTPFGNVTVVHPEFAPSTRTIYFDTAVRRLDFDLRRPRSAGP